MFKLIFEEESVQIGQHPIQSSSWKGTRGAVWDDSSELKGEVQAEGSGNKEGTPGRKASWLL